MKKLVVISLMAAFSIGCGDTTKSQVQSVANTSANNSTGNAAQKKDDLTVVSHSSEKSSSTSKTDVQSTSPNSGGSPMAKAIDVSEMTEKIEKAEKEYKAKPKDAKAKEALATAYFERAFALTDAAQYRAAVGDFRKGLKLKPDDKEANDMYEQIVDIFRSIGREPPKEGEEPPPMPFKKEN